MGEESPKPASTPTGAVFLSYASQDAEAAQKICDALGAAGIEVWFDQSELRGGDAWDRQIRKQIHHCTLFIAIISAHSDARREGYFRREWKLAVERTADMAEDVPFLIPVVIDSTKDATARVPERFQEVQWSHAPDGNASPAFLERVRALLAPEPPQPSSTTKRSTSTMSRDAPAAQVPWRAWWSMPALLAFAVVAISGGTYLALNRFVLSKRSTPTSTVIGEKSIAVLPFTDLSEKHDQEYFADGIAEELLEVLANVPELRVIGRTSSFQFKGKTDDLRVIGAKLGAAHVVEGSVRRSGDRVRVTAQLIRTADGAHEWSGTYDRNISDTLQLESEIAAALGRALELSVGLDGFLTPIQTSSPEANDHYLRGLHALDTYSRDGLQEAAGQFEAAIALDPKFTPAYESLGLAHLLQAADGFVSPDVGFPELRKDALKVLQLNSQSAVGHGLLARVASLYSWDWHEAQRESDTALALAPHSWGALYVAADLAFVLGDFERSERLFRASLVSDPLNADTHLELGQVLQGLSRLADAEAETRRGLAITPTYALGHYQLATILMLEGGKESVVEECDREIPEGGQQACLAEAYHSLGRAKEANAALERSIKEHGDDQAFWIACVFAYSGEADRAFEWLDRAYRQKDPILPYIKAAHEFKNLRGDPRYEAFLNKMNLPVTLRHQP
jgi:TolB-like protein